MWAVIGVYHGQEDNQLFAGADGAVLEPTERFSITPGEIRPLDAATIDAVQAAGGRYLGAVHVHGGDLFGTPRSTWRDGVEQPNDESALPALFERMRAREDTLGRAMIARRGLLELVLVYPQRLDRGPGDELRGPSGTSGGRRARR